MSDQEATQLMTAADFMTLQADGYAYELINGRLVEMSPAGYEHGSVAAVIIYFLVEYARRTKRGRVQTSETGFRTRRDDRTVRAPDAAFMPYTKVPETERFQGYLDIAPDLVVEVISPHDSAEAVEAKTQEWLDFGVRMVWNCYPSSQRIHIFRSGLKSEILTVNDTLEGGDILPGFRVEVSAFFEG